MLPPANRLRRQRDFQRIFRAGSTARSPYLILRRVSSNTPRVGFVVSTTVSKRAVVRNKLRRQMRSMVREMGVPANTDMVIIAQKAALKLSYATLKHEIERLVVAPPRPRAQYRPHSRLPAHPLP